MEENLARQAELAPERQGDRDSLFYEGRRHAAGSLDDRAKRHLAATKYPREITIVPVVPLTSVGKLDRKKLREWIKG
jgi:acyl-CoA synthetase (AMP-forming)/AMP-acid ligase II